VLQASPFEGKSPAEAAGRPCYDCKVDIWSAGVVCYEVLTGRAPFAAETVAKVVEVSDTAMVPVNVWSCDQVYFNIIMSVLAAAASCTCPCTHRRNVCMTASLQDRPHACNGNAWSLH
jgi:serine/threonine protein kinase